MKTLVKQISKNYIFKIFRLKILRQCLILYNHKYGIPKYFSDHNIRKLHIGCGANSLDGWLNSDYHPISRRLIHVDATKTFPFANNEFDYVFSEHMIEHFSFEQGQHMQKECWRVLKKGGKIRISTPDLRFLIDLYGSDKSEIQYRYIKWATEEAIEYAPFCDCTFVINNFVRDWGHQFIYDERTLRYSLEIAGFKNITKFDLNSSEDDALKNLEHEKRMPKGFLQLESITLEGTK